MWRKQSHNAHFYQVYVFLLHAPCVCQNSISNGSAGNTLYKPVQTISTHFSHLFLCLFFLLLSAWSWVCLSRCLSTHPSYTRTVTPLCTCMLTWANTLLHDLSWEMKNPIHFLFVFLPCPSSPSPFECACFSGKSCKPKKTLLVFRWPADQVCRCFQFLILVKSSAAADWACEE